MYPSYDPVSPEVSVGCVINPHPTIPPIDIVVVAVCRIPLVTVLIFVSARQRMFHEGCHIGDDGIVISKIKSQCCCYCKDGWPEYEV